MPGTPYVMLEEAPRMPVVLVLHQNPHSAALLAHFGRQGVPFVLILFPDHGKEEGPRGKHDGYVGEDPGSVVPLQAIDDAEEEGVLGNGAHGVVAYAGRGGAAHPGGIGEERVEAAIATLRTNGSVCCERVGYGRLEIRVE